MKTKYNDFKHNVIEHYTLTQQINKMQEKVVQQELVDLFTEISETDYEVWGQNNHIHINDNVEVIINVNGYVSVTNESETVWYQVIVGDRIDLPYSNVSIDFNYSGFDIDSIINSFLSEEDLCKFMQMLEKDLVKLKQRYKEISKTTLRLQLAKDDKFAQEIISFGKCRVGDEVKTWKLPKIKSCGTPPSVT